MEANSDYRIIATAEDAILAKHAASEAKYYSDPFSAPFAQAAQPKTGRKRHFQPIIKRGTHARVCCMDRVLSVFLKTHAARGSKAVQIIILGAGKDTSYFRLFSKSLMGLEEYRTPTTIASSKSVPPSPLPRVKWFEVDHASVIQEKVKTIRSSPMLSQCCPGLQPTADMPGGYHSDETFLRFIPADLREDPSEILTNKLKLKAKLPTLFVLECVFMYMPTESTEALLRGLAKSADQVSIALYEPILGHDSNFGRMMQQNLVQAQVAVPTSSLLRTKTLEDQLHKVVSSGFSRAVGADMWSAYETLVTAEQRQQANRAEFLDELEEWILIMRHYCFVVGTTVPDKDPLTMTGPESVLGFMDDRQIRYRHKRQTHEVTQDIQLAKRQLPIKNLEQNKMTLDSLVLAASSNLKFVFVGGKGGVGKTTSSSAIATILATYCGGKRVLLVSTDPAHSLGDAWRQSFSSTPTRVTHREEDNSGTSDQRQDAFQGSLDVMEVNPRESMESELNHLAELSRGLLSDDDSQDDKEKSEEWTLKLNEFQEWLSGIPGIDEATALSSAISHIESGKYDIIVFDTAPTGHTLKLLALPAILEKGIDQLQSWQTTFWGYWETFKAVSGGASLSKAQRRTQLKEKLKDQLTKYKEDIQKMALMLQDQERTRFVVVCIAEYLSISETKRLLRELQKYKVVASHVIVNQLVVQDALSSEELSQLESLAEIGKLGLPTGLLEKTIHACRLTTSRKTIQQRYLSELKASSETQSIQEGICELPLLAEEVTGSKAIQRFSKLMISQKVVDMAPSGQTEHTSKPTKLYDDQITMKKLSSDPKNAAVRQQTFCLGDVVEIANLAKSPHLNGLNGAVTAKMDPETNRYKVSIQYQGRVETLDLHPSNIIGLPSNDKKRKLEPPMHHGNQQESAGSKPAVALSSTVEKARRVLDDPEIKAMISQNERYRLAVEECLANPINVMKYLGDPQMSALISKAITKL